MDASDVKDRGMVALKPAPGDFLTFRKETA
jgi:hypothetical protein